MKPGVCPEQALTPATAMLAELVRRYWILGMECSLLEVQKLAWFLERAIERLAPDTLASSAPTCNL